MNDTPQIIIPERVKAAWETFKLKPLPIMRMGDVEPKPFQYFAVYRALSEWVFALGLPTGTGKTFISYLIYAYYRSQHPNTKLLVSTKNSAIIQFAKEWDKFFDDCTTIGVMHPDMPRQSGETYAQARARLIERFTRPGDPTDPMNRNPDVLIMGHAGMRLERDKIVAALHHLQMGSTHTIFVLDEATVVQKYRTETHKAARQIAKLCSRKVPMTATMTKGKLEIIYMIFSCMGLQLTKNKEEFLEQYCMTIGDGEDRKVVGYKNTIAFVEQLKKVALVLKKRDIAPYLPSFTPSFSRLDQDTAQIKYIDKLLKGDIKTVDKATGDIKDTLPITQIQWTKMALCDPVTRLEGRELPADYISPKTKELMELLENEYVDERVVIYTPYLKHVNALHNVIRRATNRLDPRYTKPLRITGEQSPAEREQIKETFTDGTHQRLMFINDAGTEALNLQAANNIILMTMPQTGGNLIQLAGRISRMGTVHSALNIRYMLHNESQDEDEYAILMQQAALIARVQGGDPEPGLIDEAVLQDVLQWPTDKVEQMISQTADRVLLHQRRKRANWYVKAAAAA